MKQYDFMELTKQITMCMVDWDDERDITVAPGYQISLFTYRNTSFSVKPPVDSVLEVCFLLPSPPEDENEEFDVPSFQMVGIISSILVVVCAELKLSLVIGPDEPLLACDDEVH